VAQSVIPGTYIDVRAGGLISAGGVSSGVVGIIGTARMGPVGEPVTLSGPAHARDVFGSADPFTRSEDTGYPLTLVRALELLYGNGASDVIAVWVAAPGTVQSATFELTEETQSNTVVRLQARSPGSWE
jgi:hypothetical protein